MLFRVSDQNLFEIILLKAEFTFPKTEREVKLWVWATRENQPAEVYVRIHEDEEWLRLGKAISKHGKAEYSGFVYLKKVKPDTFDLFEIKVERELCHLRGIGPRNIVRQEGHQVSKVVHSIDSSILSSYVADFARNSSACSF